MRPAPKPRPNPRLDNVENHGGGPAVAISIMVIFAVLAAVAIVSILSVTCGIGVRC